MFRARLVTTLRGIGKLLCVFVEHPVLILALVIAVGLLKSAVS